jgi:hypothetical protein
MPRRGLYRSARGFNPGNRPKSHRALKGRQSERGENMRLPCNHLSPFQGGSPEGWFPRVESLG